ncbi:MAG: HEAT repeat domain-containing protein [Proteobacteria bacterium]|nr:HEAT repeat domain-containing protein [Pseudomonadota bacterium]
MESLDSIIIDFAKTLKAVSFYPESHPALVSALQRIVSNINSFAKKEPLIIEITKEAISTKNTRIPVVQPVLRDLVQTLILRRVNKIIFNHGVDADELYTFMQFLTMEAGNIFSAGGLEVLIENSNIRNIALSETQLSKNLVKKKDEKQDVLVTGTDIFDVNLFVPKEEAPVKHAETSYVKETLEREKISIEEAFRKFKLDLIESKAKNDSAKYIAILKELTGFLNNLDWGIYFKNIIEIIELLIAHIEDKTTLPGISKEAKKFLNERLNEKRLLIFAEILIKNINLEFVANKIRKIFKFIGEPAVEVFLSLLSSANDIKTRKIIINELTQMGDVAFNRVVYHLTDERWYIVRNMVTILGIFGKKEAIPYLLEVSKHSDARIRKEVVKSLARIQDPQAFNILREMLNYETEDVRKLIIFSLGIMKDTNSIKSILSVLENESSISLKKEALVALGRIGHHSILPILKKYATKKGFFNKAENKVLRLSAIDGLSEIKHEDSAKILEKLLKDSDDDIRDAAFEALQKIKLKSVV